MESLCGRTWTWTWNLPSFIRRRRGSCSRHFFVVLAMHGAMVAEGFVGTTKTWCRPSSQCLGTTTGREEEGMGMGMDAYQRQYRNYVNRRDHARALGPDPPPPSDVPWHLLYPWREAQQRTTTTLSRTNVEDAVQLQEQVQEQVPKSIVVQSAQEAVEEEINHFRDDKKKTVVVLGTGWAAHSFVKSISTEKYQVVVVSPVNHFVFTPMLASAAVGTVEYRSMTEPIRVTSPQIDYVEGRAVDISVEQQTVTVQLTSLSTVTGAFKGVSSVASDRLEPDPLVSFVEYRDNTVVRDDTMGAGGLMKLSYDHLVCAVGTVSKSHSIPGAKEHCFPLKTSQDAKRLRTAIGEALEFASRPDVQTFDFDPNNANANANIDPLLAASASREEERRRRLRFAIIGGGPTGVELAGELSDLFRQICAPGGAYHFLNGDIQVLLIQGGSELVPAMHPELRARAREALEAQGVLVWTNTRLREVGRHFVEIYSVETPEVVETIPVGLTVWAAGNAPVPFVRALLKQLPPSAEGPGGRVHVDTWLRCVTDTNTNTNTNTNTPHKGSILVLGDIAYSEQTLKSTTETKELPQTAQVAGQQGVFAAQLFNRGYDVSKDVPTLRTGTHHWWLPSQAPPFRFVSLGLLAYVGREEALNQVEVGEVPLFLYSGKFAFALWRSVYFAKQASTRNQALVAFDWWRAQQFGRDITRL